ncbi:hypothetical protein R9K86_00755, partial [Escherichia coli]
MKAENARQVQGLIELEKFNPETLCSGESWMAPSASEVSVVRALIPLTDRHCCKVSDEAAFCLIQRPYISKTLLT